MFMQAGPSSPVARSSAPSVSCQMKTPYAPLACPGLAESRESFIERVGMWLPIIGWGAASLAYDLRVRPYVRNIKEQVEKKGSGVFPDPVRAGAV